MLGVLAADILNAKIVNDEGKDDGSPAVVPEAWCSRSLVVSVLVEVGCKQIVGQFAGLFKIIDPFLDLEVYPAVAGQGAEVIFVGEFLRYDSKFYLYVFMSV